MLNLLLQKLKKNLAQKDIEFEITLPLKEKITELGYDPIFGARNMRRVIQDKVENVLATALLANQILPGQKVSIDPKEFKLKLNNKTDIRQEVKRDARVKASSNYFPEIRGLTFFKNLGIINDMKKILRKAKILFIPCEGNHYKPRFLAGGALFYFVLTLLFLKLIAISFVAYFPKTIFFADLTKTALIQLTNQERQSLGLSTLKENSTLDQAAQQKAQDMLSSDYFSHYSPTGVCPWYWFKKVGYNYQLAGENLAIGFLDSEEVLTGLAGFSFP